MRSPMSDWPAGLLILLASIAQANSPDRAASESHAEPLLGRVWGRVVNLDFEPAAGVAVELVEADWRDYEPPEPDRWRGETDTDADGRFAFQQVPPGGYAVVAKSAERLGMSGAGFTEDEPEGGLSFDVVLEPAGPLQGRVVDAEGQPVAGAWVAPADRRGEKRSMPVGWAKALAVQTNAEGRFAIERLWHGQWRLIAKAPGYGFGLSPFASVGAEAVTVVLPVGASISGQVVEQASGVPVAEATVSIGTGFSPDGQRSTTGPDGTFAFTELRPAKYGLRVRHDTLVATTEPLELAVAAGEEYEVAVGMTPGGVITGRVTDGDSGEGIEGVAVQAYPGDLRKATTDASGYYRLTGRNAGVQRVAVNPIDGYQWGAHHEQTVTVRLGETLSAVDFVLERRPGIAVGGVVIDEEGRPVPMARVDAKSAHHESWSYTKDDGSFTYRHEWPTQSLVIQATRDDWVSATCGPMTIEPGGREAITLRLEPGATIQGRLVDERGLPVRYPDFESVTAVPEDSGQPSRGTSRCSWYGQFKIEGLPPGTYTVTTDQSAVKTARVTVGPGEQVDGIVLVQALPQPRLTIAGRVVDDVRSPVPLATIMVDGEGGSIHSDEDGRFRVKDLEAGPHRVTADHPHYSSSATREVSAGEEGILLTMTRRGTVEGRVVRADNGRPVGAYEVKVANYPVGSLDGAVLDGLERVHQPEGRLSLKGVGPGKATIIVRAPGLMPTALVVSDMRPGEARWAGVVRLAAEARLAGRAVDEAGEPVAGALLFRKTLPLMYLERCTLVPLSGPERERLALAKTGEDGRFEFGGLPAEAQLVALCHPAFEVSTQEVVPQPGRTVTVDFVLTSGGTIAGTMTHDGRPLEGIGVLATVYEPRPCEKEGKALVGSYHGGRGMQAQKLARTDANGRYVIRGLPPGSADVAAWWVPGDLPEIPEGSPPWEDPHLAGRDNVMWRRREVAAEVKAEWTTEVDIDFPSGEAVIQGAIRVHGELAGRAELMITGSPPDGTREAFHGSRLTEGAYRVTGVSPGEWQVRVFNVQPPSLDGYFQNEKAATVRVEAGAVVVVDFHLPEE